MLLKVYGYPCRDLGMLPEAEDLLSDICRFYSEDQWLELSAPSYALLADCQRQLELEDQYLPPSTVHIRIHELCLLYSLYVETKPLKSP